MSGSSRVLWPMVILLRISQKGNESSSLCLSLHLCLFPQTKHIGFPVQPHRTTHTCQAMPYFLLYKVLHNLFPLPGIPTLTFLFHLASPTHYFSNMPVIFSPQSLCIGYSICLECSFPTSPRGYPLISLSPFQSYLLVNTVSALHPKTTRNLPAVERVGFIACCNEGEHPPWGTVRFSVWGWQKGLTAFGLVFV